jgi:hypothetical protein
MRMVSVDSRTEEVNILRIMGPDFSLSNRGPFAVELEVLV